MVGGQPETPPTVNWRGSTIVSKLFIDIGRQIIGFDYTSKCKFSSIRRRRSILETGVVMEEVALPFVNVVGVLVVLLVVIYHMLLSSTQKAKDS